MLPFLHMMNTDHRKSLDGTLLLASEVILIIASIPAFVPKLARVVTFVVLGLYFYHVIFTQTTGDFDQDLILGSSIIFQYISFLDYALLTPPENLKDLSDKDPTRVTQRPLKKRVLWIFKLMSNPRGIGWAHEPSHLPPRPSTPRSKFVISRLALSAICCFLVVAGRSVLSVVYADASMLLIDAPLHRRVVGVLSFGLSGFSVLCGVNAIISAVVVGCGISSPERWPRLFGSPLEVWSIRNFWRRFWHQLIRKTVLSCATSFLGCVFPTEYVDTTGYKLAQIYTVFFLSAIGHTGGDVMATGNLGLKSFVFFMLQPFGITFELVISYFWHRFQGQVNPTTNGRTQNIPQVHLNPSINNRKLLTEESLPPLWIRCVGSIWVVLWMVWTAAYMVDAYSARLFANSG